MSYWIISIINPIHFWLIFNRPRAAGSILTFLSYFYVNENVSTKWYQAVQLSSTNNWIKRKEVFKFQQYFKARWTVSCIYYSTYCSRPRLMLIFQIHLLSISSHVVLVLQWELSVSWYNLLRKPALEGRFANAYVNFNILKWL